MAGFRVGQRVAVRNENDYDRGNPVAEMKPMAGYYGHVRSRSSRLVFVELSGHINGRRDRNRDVWPFYEDELEAVD